MLEIIPTDGMPVKRRFDPDPLHQIFLGFPVAENLSAVAPKRWSYSCREERRRTGNEGPESSDSGPFSSSPRNVLQIALYARGEAPFSRRPHREVHVDGIVREDDPIVVGLLQHPGRVKRVDIFQGHLPHVGTSVGSGTSAGLVTTGPITPVFLAIMEGYK